MFIKKYAKLYFNKYSDLLEQKPLQTKLMTTSGLYIAGDVFAQKFMMNHETIDWKKTSCGNVIATGMAGIFHYYYGWQNTLMLSGRLVCQTASKFRKVATTLLLDQLTFSPLTNSMFLFGVAALIEKSFYKAAETWKDRFVNTQKCSYMMWPMAQFINLYYIPLQFRLLFMNVVGLFWTSIRSYITFNVNTETPVQQMEECNKHMMEHIQHTEQSQLNTFFQIAHNRLNDHFANYNQFFDNNIFLMQGVQF